MIIFLYCLDELEVPKSVNMLEQMNPTNNKKLIQRQGENKQMDNNHYYMVYTLLYDKQMSVSTY